MLSDQPFPPAPASRSWVFPVILLLGVLLAFAGVYRNQFVEDDDGIYVSANPHVLSGLSTQNIQWAFTNRSATLWIPLTWLSLQSDASLAKLLGGPAASTHATVYHLDNLLLHALGTLLLYFFLERATEARWSSFAAALLWAIHPLRVESVAWATERKDVLSGCFAFLSLLLYTQWCRKPSIPRYTLLVLCFLLSLMAKTMFITLPFALLLLDFWPLQRWSRLRDAWPRIREKLPLFAITFAFCAIQYAAAASASYGNNFTSIPISQRLASLPIAYLDYLRLHVDLGHLAFFYPHRHTALWQSVIAALLLLAVTAFCFRLARRRPWLLVGWLWFLGTMVPMIGLVQTGDQAYADRFTYIPSIGLFIMLVWSIPWDRFRVLATAALAILAAALCFFTILQVSIWQDSRTLALHAVQVTHDNYAALGMLGLAYERSHEFDRAIDAYQQALAIRPDATLIRTALAAAYFDSRHLDDALAQFARVVQETPNNPNAHNLYGIALGQTGHFRQAAEQFQIASRLKPADEQLRRNYQRAMQLAEQQENASSRPATRK